MSTQSRRGFLQSLSIGATAFAATAVLAQRAKPQQPNIIVMLSDDMGWRQVGFNGGKVVDTPNLNRIAREGAQLTQFYAQPVCTPTRACFLTGRYSFRTGTVIRFTPNDTAGMLTDERTLADALRDTGYFTAIVGKWHLGAWQKKHLPMQRGFDYQYGHYGALIDYYLKVRGGVYDWHRNEQPLDEEGYTTDLIARDTARLIREHDGKKPFFIYAPFNAVHGPHTNQAPADLIKEYMKKSEKPSIAHVDAQVEAMDTAVGEILDAVEEKGLAKDTIVVFFNDNGGTKLTGNGPWRGAKTHYHEGGIRVPCVIRWPGQIPPGSKIDDMAHTVDLYPTLLKLAGGSLNQPLPLDGVDLWPTLSKGKPSPRKEIAHSTKVVRLGDWKFIDGTEEYYGWLAEEDQLYNIADDPYETENLVDARPEIVSQMRERLKYWATQERPAEAKSNIPGWRTLIYGEEECADPPAWLKPKVEAIRASGKDGTLKERPKREKKE